MERQMSEALTLKNYSGSSTDAGTDNNNNNSCLINKGNALSAISEVDNSA